MTRPWSRRLALLLLAALLCPAATGVVRGAEASAPPSTAPSSSATPPLRSLYFERESFLAAVTAPPGYRLPRRPRVGVVPHHLLASDMIAGFFALAGGNAESYDTVLLLAPSHYPENCASSLVTAAASWSTPHGLVRADTAAVDALLADPVLRMEQNPAALEADHGVAGLIPFVRYYLPEASVLPVLIAADLPAERLQTLYGHLEGLLESDRVLVVASVDFSHYLSPGEATRRDEETALAVESRAYEKILAFGDANVDSPKALTTALRLGDSQNLELVPLDHSSSPEKLPHATDNPIYAGGITTYFVYAAC